MTVALDAPFNTLCENANISPETIWNVTKPNIGMDFKTMLRTDLIEAGILDPTQVVINSLTVAVSIAKLVLLTDTVILPREDL